MKKAIIIFMMLGTLAIPETLGAQNETIQKKQSKRELKEEFTPEQKAELLSKRMTLNLDLNESQQTKVKQLFLDFQKDRPSQTKSGKELTSDERFELRKNRIDKQIVMKKEMKEILTPEQFEKWEQSTAKRRSNHKKASKRTIQKDR